MIPWEQLGHVKLATGEELTLKQRAEEFSVSVDDVVLMNSLSHFSEEQLAIVGCAHLEARPRARVLVGGLGMGFTLRAALDVLPADATVEVAELLPEMVEWNRGPLGHLAGNPLDDARTWVRTEDVRRTLACAEDRYDAILLDVDNGPVAFTSQANDALYSAEGLQSVRRALRGGGVLALWSTHDDGDFTARLRANGFHARKKRVPARPKGNFIHVLWLATKVRPVSTARASASNGRKTSCPSRRHGHKNWIPPVGKIDHEKSSSFRAAKSIANASWSRMRSNTLAAT